jgi:hypothetical protein
MRKAAGIILIILGVVVVAGMVIDVVEMDYPDFPSLRVSMLLGNLPYTIISSGLLVAGGILCFKRRHWGVCLVSAVITLAFWIIPAVAMLMMGDLSIGWRFYILVVGAILSTIFISRRKKEWQEFSDSMDGKVSYDG